MKKVFLCIFISTLILSLSHLSITPAHAAEVIKVGIIDTYTGPATTYTQDVLDGFKLAVNEINAKGGVSGRRSSFL